MEFLVKFSTFTQLFNVDPNPLWLIQYIYLVHNKLCELIYTRMKKKCVSGILQSCVCNLLISYHQIQIDQPFSDRLPHHVVRFRHVRLDNRIYFREPSRSQHLGSLLDAPRRPHALAVLVIERDGHTVEEAHPVAVASVRAAHVVGGVRVQVDVDHGHDASRFERPM